MSFDFTKIEEVHLQTGAHDDPASGLCFMEMVAWFAGEEHSDRPICACPVLGAFGMALNDSILSTGMRNRLLKPLVPLMAGTNDPLAMKARASFLIERAQRAVWQYPQPYPMRRIEDARLAIVHGYYDGAARMAADVYTALVRDGHDMANNIFTKAADSLRDAIMIGRHEGFDVAINLEQRYEDLLGHLKLEPREMEMAE